MDGSDTLGLKGGVRGAQMFRRRVDTLLDILDNARQDKRFTRLPPSTFQGIDATGYFNLHDDEMLIDRSGLGDDGKPRRWPIETSMIMESLRSEDPREQWPEGALQIHRARSVEPRDVRGKCKVISKFILRLDALIVHPDEDDVYRYRGGSFYYGLVGRHWVDVSTKDSAWTGVIGHSPRVPFGARALEGDERCNIFVSYADNNHYRWFVEIGRRDGFSFKFATIPEKAAAIFRLREIPDGEKRRRALRNWVTSHWRSDYRDPEMEVYVRQHLRGAEEFEWDGYFCRVIPSNYDLELNTKLAEERQEMGAQGRRAKFVMPDKPRIRVPALIRHIEERPWPSPEKTSTAS